MRSINSFDWGFALKRSKSRPKPYIFLVKIFLIIKTVKIFLIIKDYFLFFYSVRGGVGVCFYNKSKNLFFSKQCVLLLKGALLPQVIINCVGVGIGVGVGVGVGTGIGIGIGVAQQAPASRVAPASCQPVGCKLGCCWLPQQAPQQATSQLAPRCTNPACLAPATQQPLLYQVVDGPASCLAYLVVSQLAWFRVYGVDLRYIDV